MTKYQKVVVKAIFGPLFAFGLGYLVGMHDCGDDLENRRLYLDCLHEYSLGAILGDDENDRLKAQRYCAALAELELVELDIEDITPND